MEDKTVKVKYPRTYHLPWSESITDDDRRLESMAPFEGRRVIVTEKVDGENTSLYRSFLHARSLDSRNHPSRNWVKQFWGQVKSSIPEGWRICGENLYARHSIHYTNLRSYFLGFSVWDDHNVCLSWDNTLEWFQLLGITPVQTLFDGVYDEKAIRSLWNAHDRDQCEGYVVRVADHFEYRAFSTSVAKFVRKGHVQTDKHWMSQSLETNRLSTH